MLTGLLILLLLITGLFFLASGPSWKSINYNKIITYPDAVISIQKDTIRLITFNIGWLSGMTNNLPLDRPYKLFEENLAKTVAVFDKLEPDIIAFQEIDYDAHRSYNIDQFAEIAQAGKFAFAGRVVNWDDRYVPFPYWPPKHHFQKTISGQAITSTFPIVNQERILNKKTIDKPFYWKAFYLNRLFQVCILEVNNREIALINTHLEAFDPVTRYEQAFELGDLYLSYAENYPVIIAGDFNSHPPLEYYKGKEGSEKVMSLFMDELNLQSAMVNLDLEYNEQAFTYPSDNPGKKIDYILYDSTYFRNIKARVLDEMGSVSDHLPVMMDFVLK